VAGVTGPASDLVYSFEALNFSDCEDTAGIANLRHDENDDSGKPRFNHPCFFFARTDSASPGKRLLT
jgi:hypothetical protein